MMNTIAMILLILALEAILILQLLRVMVWIAQRLVRIEEKWMREGGEKKRILLILRRILLSPL